MMRFDPEELESTPHAALEDAALSGRRPSVDPLPSRYLQPDEVAHPLDEKRIGGELEGHRTMGRINETDIVPRGAVRESGL